MAPMLLPAPLVLRPTVGEIDLPRPSMASPVISHMTPMLPLDALPDENPNLELLSQKKAITNIRKLFFLMNRPCL
jgi:hypothetical protein